MCLVMLLVLVYDILWLFLKSLEVGTKSEKLIFILIVFIGIASGALTGLTGASGMSVLISGLLIVGVPIREIIALTFFVTFFNSVGAIIPFIRKQNLNWKFSIWMGVHAFGGVFLGNFLSSVVSNQNLTVVIISVLFITGLRFSIFSKKSVSDQLQPRFTRPVFFAILGILAGVIMGIMGAGGGVFITIAMVLIFRLPLKESLGIAIFVMGVSSLAGIIINGVGGGLSYNLLLPITLPAILSSYIASRLVNKINDKIIFRLLGIYLIIISLVITFKEFI